MFASIALFWWVISNAFTLPISSSTRDCTYGITLSCTPPGLERDRADCRRQGKDDMIIGDRQQLRLALGEP